MYTELQRTYNTWNMLRHYQVVFVGFSPINRSPHSEMPVKHKVMFRCLILTKNIFDQQNSTVYCLQITDSPPKPMPVIFNLRIDIPSSSSQSTGIAKRGYIVKWWTQLQKLILKPSKFKQHYGRKTLEWIWLQSQLWWFRASTARLISIYKISSNK